MTNQFFSTLMITTITLIHGRTIKMRSMLTPHYGVYSIARDKQLTAYPNTVEDAKYADGKKILTSDKEIAKCVRRVRKKGQSDADAGIRKHASVGSILKRLT